MTFIKKNCAFLQSCPWSKSGTWKIWSWTFKLKETWVFSMVLSGFIAVYWESNQKKPGFFVRFYYHLLDCFNLKKPPENRWMTSRASSTGCWGYPGPLLSSRFYILQPMVRGTPYTPLVGGIPTPLKNISQLGLLFPICPNIWKKHVPNHQWAQVETIEFKRW